jgi:hypothetical protein
LCIQSSDSASSPPPPYDDYILDEEKKKPHIVISFDEEIVEEKKKPLRSRRECNCNRDKVSFEYEARVCQFRADDPEFSFASHLADGELFVYVPGGTNFESIAFNGDNGHVFRFIPGYRFDLNPYTQVDATFCDSCFEVKVITRQLSTVRLAWSLYSELSLQSKEMRLW